MSKFTGAKAGFEAGKQILKKLFTGNKQKTTGQTVNPFQRKTMRSDYSAKIGQFKVDLAKLRGGSKKLQTDIEEVRGLMKGAGSTNPKRPGKMGGGFMGKRMGYKRGTGLTRKSNIQKINETFGPKKNNPKMSKAKKKFPDLTGDGKVTFADILKGRGVINGKKKKA
jgi:hypothetical protein